MSEKKTCTNCNTKHSEEWNLTRELSRSNQRMFIALITVIALWFATIFGFVWYLNQYDFTSYDVQQDGEWGNTFIQGGNEGDIDYGAENSNESSNFEETQEG